MSYDADFLSIDYTELDNGLPAILINSELTFPIASKSFAKLVVSILSEVIEDKDTLTHLDNLTRLNRVSGNKVSFTVIDDDTIQLKYTTFPIGYVTPANLLEVFTPIIDNLNEQVCEGGEWQTF